MIIKGVEALLGKRGRLFCLVTSTVDSLPVFVRALSTPFSSYLLVDPMIWEFHSLLDGLTVI